MKSELNVITSAKKLFEYILVVTMKSPVVDRYTFVNKMHNLCMDIIEDMYFANASMKLDERRYEYQNSAMTKLKLLDFVCESAKNSKCITQKQYTNISNKIYECINLLSGWIKSDERRKSVTL